MRLFFLGEKSTSLKQRLPFLLFPAAVIYYEILFKVLTVGKILSPGTIFLILFSVVYGIAGYLLSTIWKNEKINRVITAVLLLITALVFLVEYFVFRKFKIFYDINTVFGGAEGVATGFLGQIISMVLSPLGLLAIVLYVTPTLLFLIFGRGEKRTFQSNWSKRAIAVLIACVILGINLLCLRMSPLYVKYQSEYSFDEAVAEFGLVTGLRLDITHLIQGNNLEEYGDAEENTTESEGEDLPEIEEETPPEYGENSMEIDFSALAAGTSNRRLADIDKYVSGLTPSKKNKYTGLFKGKNLIFITAESFSAEVIDPDLTPTLYRLATKGINFTDYYQPASAGTTGGEFQNLIGLLPMAGGKSMTNIAENNLYFTMGNQLGRLGYCGKAFHNNTYTFYDRHLTHTKLGYSDGYMGFGNGLEEYVTNTWPESDLEMLAGTLPLYLDRCPFNLYYMSVSGHGDYSFDKNYIASKNRDAVASLPYSEEVKGYLAGNLELEYALEKTVELLEEKGIADDTVICISADHFPYGLDDGNTLGNMPNLAELYGYTPENDLQRDHNRLIIWSGCLEDQEPIIVSEPTFSLDIIPTLSNLFGTEFDSRLLVGRDVLSDAEALVFNVGYDWKTSLGTYTSADGTFTPASEDTEIPDGYVERIKSIVRDKIKFCGDVAETDYYAHVFG